MANQKNASAHAGDVSRPLPKWNLNISGGATRAFVETELCAEGEKGKAENR